MFACLLMIACLIKCCEGWKWGPGCSSVAFWVGGVGLGVFWFGLDFFENHSFYSVKF